MNLPTTTYKFIFHFVRQQKFKFLLLALSSVIWALNDVFFPYFIKNRQPVYTLQIIIHQNNIEIYARYRIQAFAYISQCVSCLLM